MKIRLSELRLKIDDLQNAIINKSDELKRGAVTESIKELNGHVEILSESFDFDSNMIEFERMKYELINLRRLLTQFNNSTKIDDHDTIQSALIKADVKRDMLRTYEAILKNKEKKNRYESGGLKGSAYYNVVDLNFSKKDLTAKVDTLKEELNSLEVLIQNANTSTIIEL